MIEVLGDAIVAAAVAARGRAYAPYSRFLVAAAVRTAAGGVFAGCNLENAAYPEGVCAEAGALSAMVLGGGDRVVEMVVAGVGVVTPWGVSAEIAGVRGGGGGGADGG